MHKLSINKRFDVGYNVAERALKKRCCYNHIHCYASANTLSLALLCLADCFD